MFWTAHVPTCRYMGQGSWPLAEGDSAPQITSQFPFLLGVRTPLILRNPPPVLKLLPLPEVVTQPGGEVRDLESSSRKSAEGPRVLFC